MRGRGRIGIAATESLGDRFRLLGRPVFIACATTLALNDHLLKHRYPGWWTGKLSDVAGLVVVTTCVSVLLGPRLGLVLAGLGFTLLKTTWVVAEVASSILGGPTIQDPTDLLALTVLVPMAVGLRRPQGSRRSPPESRGAGRLHAVRVVISAALPVAGAVLAVVSATATSCAPRAAVTLVADRGASLYALVDDGDVWAKSDDGGRSWFPSEPPRGVPSPPSRGPNVDPGPTGPQEGCIGDGTCWRLRDRRVIEVRKPGGDWMEEYRVTDAEFGEISTGCRGGQVGVLSSLAITDAGPGPIVAASYGAEGVLVREGDGTWHQVGVLSASPAEASTLGRASSTAVLLFGPVLAILMFVLGRRAWASWRRGLVAIAVGWLTTISVAGAIVVWTGPNTDPFIILGRATIAGALVTTVAAVMTARRPPREPFVPQRPDVS